MDLEQSKTAAEAIADHWYLVAGVVVGGWWLVKRVAVGISDFKEFIGKELEEKLPKVLKAELQNGLGLFVKEKVRSEIDQAFKAHEEREEKQIRSTIESHVAVYHSRKRG